MKKGITPIIAIIVLLLITIALAGAAWTYMSTYFTTLTAKNMQMVDSYCTGTNAIVVLKNIGSEGINIGTCASPGSITGTTATCGELRITRTDIDGTMYGNLDASGVLDPQKFVKFTDKNCTLTGQIKTCNYRILGAAIGPIIATITCTG
jgi:flagellin-like protein